VEIKVFTGAPAREVCLGSASDTFDVGNSPTVQVAIIIAYFLFRQQRLEALSAWQGISYGKPDTPNRQNVSTT
jgi:hypothetical protein